MQYYWGLLSNIRAAHEGDQTQTLNHLANKVSPYLEVSDSTAKLQTAEIWLGKVFLS